MNNTIQTLALVTGCLALLASPSTASAQSGPIPVSAPVRHAGVYHLDTGSWTRGASVANLLGADVVYDNTCASGLFFALDDDTLIDEGRLPSPTSPLSLESRPGCAVAYTIEGVELAYCTTQSPATVFTVDFHQTYASCSSLLGVTPAQSLNLTLPGSGVPGASSCWVVTVDLGLRSFTMLADGDGAYTGVSSQNLFGWSVRLPTPTPGTGPLIAGDPSLCSYGAGTIWAPGGTGGTGMGTLDQYRLEGGSSAPACYFGSGGIFRSFHLKLFADACSGPTGQSFCAGDGSGAACPCGNFSSPGTDEGCFNTTLRGAKLAAFGAASLSNDTLVLFGSQMPVDSPVLFLQGLLQQNGGAGTVFGDGLQCVGGSLVRLGVDRVDASGNANYPSAAGQLSVSSQGMVGSTGARTYQAWYRNVAPFCTPAGFNASNGVSLSWGS